MYETFIGKAFRAASLALIEMANAIIEEYSEQGYVLTLRQLYYQLVARDVIPNTERSYKNLGNLINDARLAGIMDWEAIEDRTRNLESNGHWEDPAEIMEGVIQSYRIDLWERQPFRVEVWIEKEALTGIIDRTCRTLDVPYFACRGYVSQSEQWRAYRRSLDKPIKILHFGDHDPSGLDMTRDNNDRLNGVFGGDVEVIRLALNMDQIRKYKPPPNPAKMTDSRFADYRRWHGDYSWELDALEPQIINGLVWDKVIELRDEELWDEALQEQEAGRERLRELAAQL